MSPQSNSTPGLSLPSPTLSASGPVQPPINATSAQDQFQGSNAPAQASQASPVSAPLVPPPAPIAAQAPVSVSQPQIEGPSPALPLGLGVQPSVAAPTPVQSAALVAAQQPQPVTAIAQDEELGLDDDALDEEWVNKAKSVAEQYQADPYMASKALSKVKAEYLQRRYGKQIKVSD